VLIAEVPPAKVALAPDETVINPYYMRQLLQYGIKLGEAQNSDMSPEALLREAEVRVNSFFQALVLISFFVLSVE
jgi:CRISPR/Cas system-associated protein Csm6